MKPQSGKRAGIFLYCAAVVIIIFISDAGYSYAARFSRSGVAAGGSFSHRQSVRTEAVRSYPVGRGDGYIRDRVGDGDGHIRDRVAREDDDRSDRVGDGDGRLAERIENGGGDAEPPEVRPPARDDGPWRNCPSGRAGRDCRRYYGYYDYYDDDDGDHIYYPETVETLPCSATVITVDRITYYRCDNTYYVQIFSGESVYYVQCESPRGY